MVVPCGRAGTLLRQTIPRSAELRCAAVQYDDLWKIRAPLHSVEGFHMDLFDNLIEVSPPAWDADSREIHLFMLNQSIWRSCIPWMHGPVSSQF